MVLEIICCGCAIASNFNFDIFLSIGRHYPPTAFFAGRYILRVKLKNAPKQSVHRSVTLNYAVTFTA